MGEQSSSSTVALNANATVETNKNALRTASEPLGVAFSSTHASLSALPLARRRSLSSTVIRISSDVACASDDISCNHGTAINGSSP